VSFEAALAYNTFTEVPPDTFRYQPNANNMFVFRYTFYGCPNLTTVYPGLFKYNTSAIHFYGVFGECVKLQQIKEIFASIGEEATRFLGKTVDMTGAFKVSSFSGVTGIAPDLWNYAGTFTKTDCWDGHSVSTISNWDDVPAAWR
jgi:hypothetical protein